MELRLQAQFEQCARLAAWLADAGKVVASSSVALCVDRVAARNRMAHGYPYLDVRVGIRRESPISVPKLRVIHAAATRLGG